MRFEPIGLLRTEATEIPRHYSVSQVEGRLILDPRFAPGLCDIEVGQKIIVLFHFDRSEPFTDEHLHQTPPNRDAPRGIFSTCSPIRPNAIGMSVLEVLQREDQILHVRGIDTLDKTPVLDIKPVVSGTSTS